MCNSKKGFLWSGQSPSWLCKQGLGVPSSEPPYIAGEKQTTSGKMRIPSGPVLKMKGSPHASSWDVSSLFWGLYIRCSGWHTYSTCTYAKSLSWVSVRVVNLPNSVLIRQEDRFILSGDKEVAWTKALLMSLFLNDFLICGRVPDRVVSAQELSAKATCSSRVKADRAFCSPFATVFWIHWNTVFRSRKSEFWLYIVKWVGVIGGRKRLKINSGLEGLFIR